MILMLLALWDEREPEGAGEGSGDDREEEMGGRSSVRSHDEGHVVLNAAVGGAVGQDKARLLQCVRHG
jgi:hypothetical protein